MSKQLLGKTILNQRISSLSPAPYAEEDVTDAKIRVVEIRNNVLQIFFSDMSTARMSVMEEIMKKGPWCFNNHLLAL